MHYATKNIRTDNEYAERLLGLMRKHERQMHRAIKRQDFDGQLGIMATGRRYHALAEIVKAEIGIDPRPNS